MLPLLLWRKLSNTEIARHVLPHTADRTKHISANPNARNNRHTDHMPASTGTHTICAQRRTDATCPPSRHQASTLAQHEGQNVSHPCNRRSKQQHRQLHRHPNPSLPHPSTMPGLGVGSLTWPAFSNRALPSPCTACSRRNTPKTPPHRHCSLAAVWAAAHWRRAPASHTAGTASMPHTSV
jgi:hypothetical protein